MFTSHAYSSLILKVSPYCEIWTYEIQINHCINIHITKITTMT
jgi:hypothetical protein